MYVTRMAGKVPNFMAFLKTSEKHGQNTHTQTMNKYNVYVTSIQPATNKLLLCLYCMYQMSYCSTAFYKPHCVNASGPATNKYFFNHQSVPLHLFGTKLGMYVLDWSKTSGVMRKYNVGHTHRQQSILPPACTPDLV